MNGGPKTRRRAAALALSSLALALLLPALARAGNPDYRSVVDSVTPHVPGIELHVLEYDSFFELRDRSGHEVLIYGYEGEPYARILRDGTVQVNQRSPAKYLNTSFFANARVPASASATAPPEWQTEARNGTFVWHDHRMHYMSPSTPPQVKDPSRRTKVFNYEVPLRIDGRRGAIHGTLYWVGSPSASKTPIIVISVVVLLGLAALLLLTRRRRGAGGGDGGGGGREERGERQPATEAW